MPKLTIDSKIINLDKIFFIVIILILLAGNIYFGSKYFGIQKELQEKTATLETQKTNEDLLNFAKLFIDKVLKAEGEIDFETRLQLENAVRNLSDNEILAQWQKFVESKTESEAQKEVKNLLEILVSKIKK